MFKSRLIGGCAGGMVAAGVMLVCGVSSVVAEEKAEPEKKVELEKMGFWEFVFSQKKKAARATATNNAKQLFFLLVEFDQDFGAFPNDKTADADDDLNAYKGKFSNDYLGQFIAGGYVKSEEIFYAKGGSSTDKKPDNEFETKETTLAAGECGFAYVKGQSLSVNMGRPLLCAPMTGKGFKFDPKPYNGKAVVLHIDGAVKHYPINKDGDVILPNGKKLFEGGADTVWGVDGLKKVKVVFPK